jgi:hypothetical protein
LRAPEGAEPRGFASRPRGHGSPLFSQDSLGKMSGGGLARATSHGNRLVTCTLWTRSETPFAAGS